MSISNQLFQIQQNIHTQIFNLNLTMDIFIGIKNDFRLMGCFEYDHPHKKLIKIAQNLFFFGGLVIYTTTSFWFFLYEAKTFTEHVESYIPGVCGLNVIFTYCCYLWQRKELLELMMEFASIIESRKS